MTSGFVPLFRLDNLALYHPMEGRGRSSDFKITDLRVWCSSVLSRGKSTEFKITDPRVWCSLVLKNVFFCQLGFYITKESLNLGLFPAVPVTLPRWPWISKGSEILSWFAYDMHMYRNRLPWLNWAPES